LGFLKEDILSFFFWLSWQPEFCMELNALKKFKVTNKGTFLRSLDEIGLAVHEEMSFKIKVYRWMPDEKRSQKHTVFAHCRFVTGEQKIKELKTTTRAKQKITFTSLLLTHLHMKNTG
jgi:hypothetical protein